MQGWSNPPNLNSFMEHNTGSPPQRYSNFQLWIQRNGCKLDHRLVIAANSSGSMGLESREQLPPHTAIMAVPEKLILTVQKCYESKQLTRLYKANDDLFDYEDSDDAQFNVLAVFVMYEKSKIVLGRRQHPDQQFHSFWQPYFDSVQQPETAMDWTPEELSGMPQDFMEEVEHFRKEIERMQVQVVTFLLKRPEFEGLSQPQLNELFNYGYKFIMTRCFGYSTPGTSLIPLADLMNHSCEAVDHQLVNTKRELHQAATKEYTKHSDKINMGALLGIEDLNTQLVSYSAISQYIGQHSQLPKEEAERLNRQQRRNKVLDINLKKAALVNSLTLNYFSSSDEEDNDTESEEEELREEQMQFLRQQEKEQMSVFQQHSERIRILEYREVEARLNEIQQREQAMKQAEEKLFEAYKSKHAEGSEKTEATTCKQQAEVTSEEPAEDKPSKPQLKAAEISAHPKGESKPHVQTRQDSFVDAAHIHKEMFDQLKESNRFKQFQDLKFTEDGKKESSDQQEDSDEEFTWFNEPGTYFLISTGRPVRKGQQLYNCYGRRTNKFLLIWYGFCYPNNLFDSVSFRFHVDFTLQHSVDRLIFDHYYGGRGLIKGFPKDKGVINSNEVSKEFRLKRSRLCEGLLIFLRLFLMNQYKGADLGKLFATLPASIEFEIFVLSFMELLVLELKKRSTNALIEEWASSPNHRVRFKATFMQEQTAIVEANLEMISEARGILVELMNDPTLTVEQVLTLRPHNPQLIRKLRKYLVSIQDNMAYIRMKEMPSVADN